MTGWSDTREMVTVAIGRALMAFVQTLCGDAECQHSKVDAAQAGGFCQDCGYQVQLEWLLMHCRQCNAKRIPHRNMWGAVKPLHDFCRHCGHDSVKMVRRPSIEIYELMYALNVKTTVYGDQPEPKQPSIRNPFQTTASMADSILDAEILGSREYRGTRSAFKSTPMDWQTRQNPRRYGANPDTESQAKVIPLLRQG